MDRLIAKIFHDYYVRNYSQTRIAEHCRISRQRVQRILSDASYRDLVEVRIKLPDGIHTTLEGELEDKYGVEEFIIVDTRATNGVIPVWRDLGEAAADYLMRVMADDMSIAITWGKTLLEMTVAIARSMNSSYRKFKNIKVVQAIGALGELKLEFHSFEIAQRLAKVLDARRYSLFAPQVAASPKAAREFLRESGIVETLDEFRKANMFFCGVGAIQRGESSVLRAGAVTSEEEAYLRSHGVSGT